MAPATVGPKAGAVEIATVINAITRPVREGGTRAVMAVNARGVAMAVATAWITRATSKIEKPGATMASNVPATNSDMARM
jgi:adenine/guanine phosphoribosyltransferase-like PRPP-binding protein